MLHKRTFAKLAGGIFICHLALLGQTSELSIHTKGRILVQKVRSASHTDAMKVIRENGAAVSGQIPQLDLYVLSVPEAELSRILHKLQGTNTFTYAELDGIAHGAATPNDPFNASQWHLGAIKAAAAWDLTTGSAAVPIAMVDSGVNPTHPDLASKLIPGWNFLLSNNNTADDLGHGTATAGVAAAASNNAVGVTGVAWQNPIMPLVVLDSTDYASYTNIASAITYAADHGVRIINVSIGGSTASSTLQNAVNYAWGKGAVVFAAAMNNSSSAPYYPAACNYVVSVSATEPGDSLASFSNYGSSIDLSAPGDNILTTDNTGNYSTWYGTSFSAPIAAASAALALSLNPQLTAQGLVNLLEQNSDDIGAPGWDQYFGWGRINAYRIAAAARASALANTTPPTVSINSPAAAASISGTVQVTGTATDNVGVTRVELWIDGQLNSTCASTAFACTWNSGSASAGSHTVQVKAYDAAGNMGSASESVSTISPTSTIKDTVPPTVAIVSPSNGATVNGNVDISVSATDNVGVSQVGIYIDGGLKATLTSGPWSYTWNAKKATSGSHVIVAKAWDAAGNSASATITVNK